MAYLAANDPEATRGLTKKPLPADLYPRDTTLAKWTQECPVCHGFGGWALRRDAYGPGQHFMAGCQQCNGWGYVKAGSKDATCVHQKKELSRDECKKRGIQHFGMCYHVEGCVKCGDISSYDSSD